MEIVPYTVEQEEKASKKNPDYELSLIGVGDRPNTEPISQNLRAQTYAATLQNVKLTYNYKIHSCKIETSLDCFSGRIKAADN